MRFKGADHSRVGGGKLWLVYTRRAGNNDHVFRHRAPLFVAEFDTDKLEQTATIHVAAADADYAGEYKDTVTFTVAVKTN